MAGLDNRTLSIMTRNAIRDFLEETHSAQESICLGIASVMAANNEKLQEEIDALREEIADLRARLG